MHKWESVKENEMLKILWHFEIQIDNLIPARRPELVIINKKQKQKKYLPNGGLCHPSEPQRENERKRKERLILGPGQRIKKVTEHEIGSDTNCNWCTRNGAQRLGKRIGRAGNRRMSHCHPNYSSIKIGQNAERSHGDARRLAVTQTRVKNYQLTLVWKNSQAVIIIIIREHKNE